MEHRHERVISEIVVACEYYDSYLLAQSQLDKLKDVILDIANSREWMRVDFSPQAVRDLDASIAEARKILNV